MHPGGVAAVLNWTSYRISNQTSSADETNANPCWTMGMMTSVCHDMWDSAGFHPTAFSGAGRCGLADGALIQIGSQAYSLGHSVMDKHGKRVGKKVLDNFLQLRLSLFQGLVSQEHNRIIVLSHFGVLYVRALQICRKRGCQMTN